MPIYDFGYRPWDGERTPINSRWWPIARTGVRLSWQSKMLRRLMWVAWFPMAYYVFFFFAVGWVTDSSGAATAGSAAALKETIFFWWVQSVFGTEAGLQLAANPEAFRPVAWSVAFYVFFAFSQGFLALLIVAVVGPPLVSRDMQSRAYLIYFSKPIPVWTYVVGKVSVLAFYMALITIVPALLLYVLSIAFSPSLGAIIDTAPVLLRLFLASLVLIIPVSLLVLYLSAITDNERVAVFSWVAIFVFGEMLYNSLVNTPGLAESDWLFLVSLRHTTMVVVGGIFDVTGQLASLGQSGAQTAERLVGSHGPNSVAVGAIALLVLSLFCFRGIIKRVTAPLEI